jgi:conjugative transfer pilus assembly protein TraH
MPVIFILLILLFSQPAFADFNSQMNEMFGSMTNVTAPQGYMDQSRGVVTGGRVTVKNKIVSAELMAFDPPSIDSGCGGIDWFAGSFSFISADQFTQLMRSIGANAAGYAFKLALTNMCPSCAAIMEDLRKAVATANSLAGDSCQAAQLVVDAVAEKIPENQGFGLEAKAKQVHTTTGGWADSFAGWVDDLNKEKSASQSATPEELKDIVGNIAWIVINEEAGNGGRLLSGFTDSSTGMAEAIMSLTGTIVTKQADNGDDKAQLQVTPYSNTLKLRDLLGEQNKETTVTLWTCPDTNDCLAPLKKEDQSIEPMIKKVRRILLGEDGTGATAGLVFRYATNTGDLTTEEKAFIELSPLHGKRIRDLSIFGVDGARIYAEQAAEKIALDLTAHLVTSVLDAVAVSAAVNPNKNTSSFISSLRDVRAEILTEQTTIAEKIQTDESVGKLFSDLRAATDRSQYAKIVTDMRLREEAQTAD